MTSSHLSFSDRHAHLLPHPLRWAPEENVPLPTCHPRYLRVTSRPHSQPQMRDPPRSPRTAAFLCSVSLTQHCSPPKRKAGILAALQEHLSHTPHPQPVPGTWPSLCGRPKPASSPSQEPCPHLSTSSLTHPLSSLSPAPHHPALPFPSDCRRRRQALGQCQPFLASLPFLSASPVSPVPPWPHRAPGWACPRCSPVTAPHHPHAHSPGGPLSGWTPSPLPPGLRCVWGPTKCLQS